jgi:ABC-type Fe3+ transport system substrate-binding protein
MGDKALQVVPALPGGRRRFSGDMSATGVKEMIELSRKAVCKGIYLSAALIALGACFSPALAQKQVTVQLSTDTPALKQMIESAKKEGGVLNVMNATLAQPEFINGISAGMTKKFGFPIKINIVPGPSPSALAPQLVQEFKAGRPAASDIFMGDDVNAMPQVAANAVINTNWRELDPSIPEEFVGPDGAFLRLSSRIMGCLWYNTNLVKPNEVPKTLNDVLNPKWKSAIATTSFSAGFREAAGLFGQEKEMLEFLKKFKESGNLAGFIRGGEVERIASGEFAMMVLATGEAKAAAFRDNGAPVNYTVLKDMPFVSYWVMDVPKNSAHPNLAKLFALFMLTREAQDLYYRADESDHHLIVGSTTGKEMARALKGITPKEVTNDVLVQNWQELDRVRPKLGAALR